MSSRIDRIAEMYSFVNLVKKLNYYGQRSGKTKHLDIYQSWQEKCQCQKVLTDNRLVLPEA